MISQSKCVHDLDNEQQQRVLNEEPAPVVIFLSVIPSLKVGWQPNCIVPVSDGAAYNVKIHRLPIQVRAHV